MIPVVVLCVCVCFVVSNIERATGNWTYSNNFSFIHLSFPSLLHVFLFLWINCFLLLGERVSICKKCVTQLIFFSLFLLHWILYKNGQYKKWEQLHYHNQVWFKENELTKPNERKNLKMNRMFVAMIIKSIFFCQSLNSFTFLRVFPWGKLRFFLLGFSLFSFELNAPLTLQVWTFCLLLGIVVFIWWHNRWIMVFSRSKKKRNRKYRGHITLGQGDFSSFFFHPFDPLLFFCSFIPMKRLL